MDKDKSNDTLTLKWSNLLDFESETVSKNASEKEGVYRLSQLNSKNREYEVFYVGRAENIKERLLEHLSQDEENDCIKNKVAKGNNKFKFALIPLEEDRKNAEHTLYHHYNKPSCNKVEPEGKIIQINFN